MRGKKTIRRHRIRRKIQVDTTADRLMPSDQVQLACRFVINPQRAGR